MIRCSEYINILPVTCLQTKTITHNPLVCNLGRGSADSSKISLSLSGGDSTQYDLLCV